MIVNTCYYLKAYKKIEIARIRTRDSDRPFDTVQYLFNSHLLSLIRDRDGTDVDSAS